MTPEREEVAFHEKIGLFGRPAAGHGREVFYGRQTLLGKGWERLCRWIRGASPRRPGAERNLKPFGWGDTRNLDGAIRRAAGEASRHADAFCRKYGTFLASAGGISAVDIPLIFRKSLAAYLFYEKYFFYELVLQYVAENPDRSYIFHLDGRHAGPYPDAFRRHGEVHLGREPSGPGSACIVEYGTEILAILYLGLFHWRRRIRRSGEPPFENDLVCIGNSPEEYRCYRELFGHLPRTRFAINENYLDFFPAEQRADGGVVTLGLSPDAYAELRSEALRLVSLLIRFAPLLYREGLQPSRFFHYLAAARAETPAGRGNICLMFEHHDLIKTIRNEYIRAAGSRSVFFSYLQGIALRHYPAEHFQNYDLVCSSGPYLERHFAESEARSTRFLKTGCYTVHRRRRSEESVGKSVFPWDGRQEGLVAVTVLCPGVCKPTYESEKKLMGLAQRLSREPGVRVLVRLKPFDPEEKYRGFYESYLEGNDRLRITGREFELFDFLDATDLFVTSYSTAACEVAACGAPVFFVDFMDHPDRFLFWEKDIAEGILLTEENAFAGIMAWVREAGGARKKHQEAMEGFRRFMGYSFADFPAYRGNLLSELRSAGLASHPAFQAGGPGVSAAP